MSGSEPPRREASARAAPRSRIILAFSTSCAQHGLRRGEKTAIRGNLQTTRLKRIIPKNKKSPCGRHRMPARQEPYPRASGTGRCRKGTQVVTPSPGNAARRKQKRSLKRRRARGAQTESPAAPCVQGARIPGNARSRNRLPSAGARSPAALSPSRKRGQERRETPVQQEGARIPAPAAETGPRPPRKRSRRAVQEGMEIPAPPRGQNTPGASTGTRRAAQGAKNDPEHIPQLCAPGPR